MKKIIDFLTLAKLFIFDDVLCNSDNVNNFLYRYKNYRLVEIDYEELLAMMVNFYSQYFKIRFFRYKHPFMENDQDHNYYFIKPRNKSGSMLLKELGLPRRFYFTFGPVGYAINFSVYRKLTDKQIIQFDKFFYLFARELKMVPYSGATWFIKEAHKKNLKAAKSM